MSEPPGAAIPEGIGRVLRMPATSWRGLGEERTLRVQHLDPPHGARGVFRDSPVVARLSRPVDPVTVSAETFLVMDEQGRVPGGVWTSLDGRVAVWTPARLLTAGRLHCVRLAGMRDRQGHELVVHESAFEPGDLALGDLGP
jgi:Bacterial Ig-like domain